MSLMDGWLPATVHAVSAIMLVLAATGWRSRRWMAHWIPVSLMFGALTAAAAHRYVVSFGLASEPAPWRVWAWTGLSATAVLLVIVGWPGVQWWRRNLLVLSASLCLLSMGLTVNTWIGYSPTVDSAWNQLTAEPLPDQTDSATVMAMQRRSRAPSHGALVPISTGADVSGFEHRDEYVYLPPAWFATSPPPRLSAVMMIGGQFNTSADWVRAGAAISTLDAFAAAHRGYAPVAVFVDSNGSFVNDTECVNGPRGNSADHLTAKVIPYVTAHFGVTAARWAVVGFSAGGTCAVDLAVMHPELFSAFVDIGGDLGPNTGTKSQTIERLFGGDADAWSTFDPATAIARHGAYVSLAGRFVVQTAAGLGVDKYGSAASTLCGVGRSFGIDCTVVSLPGRHTWPFAANAFEKALPWLAALDRSAPDVGE